MAITAQEQNFVSELMNLAEEEIALRQKRQILLARYNQNDFGTGITDQDLSEIPSFAHLTQSEMWNAITALQAIETALGDNVSGQIVNLIKLKG